MRKAVIGQTGRCVLSANQIHRKVSGKRTVRYQYQKVNRCWLAWVCGPFHSRMYGVCGFGTSRQWAKATLQRNLARDYRYLGNMIYSDVDESNNVGRIVGAIT
jgi:hypothetical protein